MITGFDYQPSRSPTACRCTPPSAAGRPIVLLHGSPQTHLMWPRVARRARRRAHRICPDLRGYGATARPADGYAKRTMAADIVALAARSGITAFALAGHDRGALVAFRAGLDHPGRDHDLASLDVLPTLDMWDVLHGGTRRSRSIST